MSHRINPGDIGLARFPMADKSAGLLHPVLVLSVEHTLSGKAYARVAYGSSQKVSLSGHLAWEFVLAPAESGPFVESGLRKATRFDLRKTARVPLRDIRLIGKVAFRDHATMARLREAMLSAQ